MNRKRDPNRYYSLPAGRPGNFRKLDSAVRGAIASERGHNSAQDPENRKPSLPRVHFLERPYPEWWDKP